ncbi:MAG TPA: hypothetical protein VGN16_09520 [Acidobacteriaceae bacterium]|jgi:hypothetical protein
MPKLNQILAVEKGIKSRVYGQITEINKIVQKAELFNGFSKTYEAKDDADEKLPAESKRVQYSVKEQLRAVERLTTELMDVTARKDFTNCVAKAPVVVDGKELLPPTPVSYLLFLEKQLTDFHTLAKNLPVLDEAETWTLDENSGLMKTAGTQTHRTKKVSKVITLVQPTVEHPGQAQMVAEDVIAGFWTQLKQSGAMPKPAKQALLDKIEKLSDAVKVAREAANVQEVVPDVPLVGKAIFGFLLGE